MASSKKKPKWEIIGFKNYPSSNYCDYAYLATLEEENNKLYKTITSLLSDSLSRIKSDSVFKQGYASLRSLYQQERAKEKQFLETYTKCVVNPEDEMVSLIKAMNQIFQNKAIYTEVLRNIESLKETDKKWTGQWSETYYLLKEALPEAIQNAADKFINENSSNLLSRSKEANIKILENIMADSLFEALFKRAEKVASGQTGVEKDFYESLLRLDDQAKNEFIKKIMNAYGISTQSLLDKFKKSISQGEKKRNFDRDQFKKAISSSADNTGQGMAFEELYNVILSQVTEALGKGGGSDSVKVTVHQTGQLGNMKADQLIYIGSVGVNTNELAESFDKGVNAFKQENENTNSRRLQNEAGLKEMLTNIDKGIQAVVEISDKSYNLTGEAFSKNSRYGHGFTAETPDLTSLQATLSKANLSYNLEDLIFILKNSGPEMINGERTDSACRAVALNIANFLFDDVNVTDMLDDQQQSLSRIHLFNLDGILIPLSVFLEGAYNAFSSNKEELIDYIDVTFHNHVAEANNNANPALEMPEDWERFNKEKMKSQVAIHFFGDFVNFIKQHMGGLKI